MKSFPYLFTATLLLSTSSLIAMDPTDLDVQRRTFPRSANDPQREDFGAAMYESFFLTNPQYLQENVTRAQQWQQRLEIGEDPQGIINNILECLDLEERKQQNTNDTLNNIHLLGLSSQQEQELRSQTNIEMRALKTKINFLEKEWEKYMDLRDALLDGQKKKNTLESRDKPKEEDSENPFPYLSINDFVCDILGNYNPLEDKGWILDTTSIEELGAKLQGYPLEPYELKGTLSDDKLTLEYLLTHRETGKTILPAVKFTKTVEIAPAPVVQPPAPQIQRAIPSVPQAQRVVPSPAPQIQRVVPAQNNQGFIGELTARVGGINNPENLAKSQAAFQKLDQPKPVQRDEPKPFVQLRKVGVPAAQPQANRPPQPAAQPVAQPSQPPARGQQAPAKKWTVKMPPQLNK